MSFRNSPFANRNSIALRNYRSQKIISNCWYKI